MDLLKRINDYTGSLGELATLTFRIIPAIIAAILIASFIYAVFIYDKIKYPVVAKIIKVILYDVLGSIAVLALIVCFINYKKQEDKVIGIRRSCPRLYEDDDITYDEVFDYLAKDVLWDTYTAKNGTKVVNVQGKFKTQDHTKFKLQFEFDDDMSEFTPRAMKINGEPVNDFVIGMFVIAMFESYKNDTGQYFDSVQSLYSFADNGAYTYEDAPTAGYEIPVSDYPDLIVGTWHYEDDDVEMIFDMNMMVYVGVWDDRFMQYNYATEYYSLNKDILTIDFYYDDGDEEHIIGKIKFEDEDTISMRIIDEYGNPGYTETLRRVA